MNPSLCLDLSTTALVISRKDLYLWTVNDIYHKLSSYNLQECMCTSWDGFNWKLGSIGALANLGTKVPYVSADLSQVIFLSWTDANSFIHMDLPLQSTGMHCTSWDGFNWKLGSALVLLLTWAQRYLMSAQMVPVLLRSKSSWKVSKVVTTPCCTLPSMSMNDIEMARLPVPALFELVKNVTSQRSEPWTDAEVWLKLRLRVTCNIWDGFLSRNGAPLMMFGPSDTRSTPIGCNWDRKGEELFNRKTLREYWASPTVNQYLLPKNVQNKQKFNHDWRWMWWSHVVPLPHPPSPFLHCLPDGTNLGIRLADNPVSVILLYLRMCTLQTDRLPYPRLSKWNLHSGTRHCLSPKWCSLGWQTAVQQSLLR